MSAGVTRVYLDHNATTPVDPRVVDAMLPFLREQYGNPSSLHWFGQRARAAVEEARASVAALVGAEPADVVFTASGSESDNMAVRGVAARAKEPRRGVVVSAIEHHAVLNTAKGLREDGVPVAVVRAAASGLVDLDDLAAKVDSTTALVSLMLANNETGVVQPVAEAARLARERGALVHCDAVQAAGKVKVDVRALGVDLLTLSAHKLYGPKGIGCLVVRRGTPMAPLVRGGGQERNRRAGTENVAGIVGVRRRGAARRGRPRGRDGARRRAARPARGAPPRPARGRAQRRGPATAEHDERLVRRRRGRGPADRPRPRGCRRVDRRRLRGRRRRAVARAARDGLRARAGPVLAAPVARPLYDPGGRRPRRRRDRGGAGEDRESSGGAYLGTCCSAWYDERTSGPDSTWA